MKRILMLLMVLTVLASAVFTQGVTEAPAPVVKPEDLSGSFTWWTFFDQAPFLKEKFEAKYPNIKVNLEMFGGNEYQTKLMTTIMSGQGVPDLMDLEEGYVYKFIESDKFADLSKLGGDALVKDYYPWAVAMGRDTKGVLKGICDNVSPVAFWYIRSAMKQWLGTDNDAEIAAKLSNWDKIIEVARDVKAKSGGKVFLLPNLGEMVKVEGYSLVPFVRNGKFAIDPAWYDLIKLMRTLHTEGLVANLGSWSGEWASAWNAGTLLIRVMPSWDFFSDWKINDGNVGVAKPPKNSYEGGTYRAIYVESNQKALVMEFIKFMTSEEFQTANLSTNNQMPANRKVIETLGKTYSAPKFGGQNLLATYDAISNGIKDIVPDKYTRRAQNLFSKYAQEGVRNGYSDEQIMNNLKKALKDEFPEIIGL
jgi:multiple sugar transport system substrate-binding protein